MDTTTIIRKRDAAQGQEPPRYRPGAVIGHCERCRKALTAEDPMSFYNGHVLCMVCASEGGRRGS